MLLAPTHAPARAGRALRALPAGGGTPLAAGLELALETAVRCERDGARPMLVILSDGKANVARTGGGGRAEAKADAEAVAAAIKARGLAALVVDTAPRPGPAARGLANAMAADYIALPGQDPRLLAEAVTGRRAMSARIERS